MKYSHDKLFNVSEPPKCGSEPFVCYCPDFTSEQELYRINNEPVNIINNAQINPLLNNIAQQQLVDISEGSPFDTSGLTDKQLVENCIPRQAEVSDLEDIASSNLCDLDRLFKESKNV